MLKRVSTNIFIEEFETKGSYPCKFECSDGKIYITKHNGLGNRGNHLVNELISALLAIEIQVRIPKFVLVEIDNEVFDKNLNFKGGKPSGLGFGSEFLADPFAPIKNFDDLSNLPPDSQIGDKSIAVDFLAIVLFDIWLMNNDRVINNPNIIVQENQKEFCIFAIDHAANFAQRNYDSLNLEIDNSLTLEDTLVQGNYFKKVRDYLGLFFDSEVEEIVKRIENISKNKISEITELVPIEWNLTVPEKQNIVNFLYRRKIKVKEQFYNILKEAGY